MLGGGGAGGNGGVSAEAATAAEATTVEAPGDDAAAENIDAGVDAALTDPPDLPEVVED